MVIIERLEVWKICHMNLLFGCCTPSFLQAIKSHFSLLTLHAIGDSYSVGYIFVLKYRSQPPIWCPVFEIWTFGPSANTAPKPIPFSPPKMVIFGDFFYFFILAKKYISNWDRDLGLPPSDVKFHCLSDGFFSRLLPPPTFLKIPKNLQKIQFSPHLL